MFNTNLSSISAISWHEQILYINVLNLKTLRNKTYLCIKQSVLFIFRKHAGLCETLRNKTYLCIKQLVHFIFRKHAGLCELNTKIMDSLQMYHNLMKEIPLPYSFKGGMTATTGPPYGSLPMPMPQQLPQDFSSQVS